MMSDAYDGLIAASAAWHSSGEYGSLSLDAPVGTPFMRILDHFTLALGWEIKDVEGNLSEIVRMALIWGAAVWRD